MLRLWTVPRRANAGPGPARSVTQAALASLRKSDNPVVVNVSSRLGSFWTVTNPERHESHNSFVVYGASKGDC
jgi:hypothetical protein